MKNSTDKFLNLSGKPNFNDLLLYSFWFYYKSAKGIRSLLYSVIMLSVSIIFIVLASMSKIPGWVVVWISAASIICVATYPIGIYYHAKKHFKNSKFYHETQEYIVNNEGIELKMETASTKVKWSAIIRIIELNSVFIIMAPNNNTYAILKRYFADESEIKVFVAMIKKNVNAKKLKLKR